MAELLIPADVTKAAVTELRDRFGDLSDYASVPVADVIPSSRPREFVRVLSVGGSARDIAYDRFTIILEGWSDKVLRAERLASFATGFIEAAARDGSVGGIPAGRCQVFALPANLPYPSLPDVIRFRSTVSVDLRRSTV